LILRENFAGGDSFNLRYVNCVAVNELRIVAKSSLEKIDTDLSKINYQELLNAEKKNMELIKKKTLIEDENVLSLFNDLNKQYPDSEWYGRSIYLPNLSVSIFSLGGLRHWCPGEIFLLCICGLLGNKIIDLDKAPL
jgi:hypothetical protein